MILKKVGKRGEASNPEFHLTLVSILGPTSSDQQLAAFQHVDASQASQNYLDFIFRLRKLLEWALLLPRPATQHEKFTMKKILKTVPLCLSALIAPSSHGAIVFNDSFNDSGFTNGADPTDAAWHGTTGNSAIEIFGGNNLSLRSGTSGRGLHAEFPTQTLSSIGDKITATFNFTTPVTIATVAKGGAFRIGLFDSNGETIHTQDGNTSEDAAWNNVLGNMVDLDVNTAGSENFQFRSKGLGLTGNRLLGTTSGFVSQGSGGEPTNYVFAANTSYTGTYSIEQTGASEWMIRSSLDDGVISDFEIRTVTSLNTSSYDILAFHVNSATFGSTNAGGDADNGIDFQNVTLEFEGVPEPSSALLALLGGMMAFRRRRA